MTQYEADKIICRLTENLKKHQKTKEVVGFGPKSSVVGKLSEGLHDVAKKWIKAGTYKYGDIVTFNNETYICNVTQSLGISPNLKFKDWVPTKTVFNGNETKIIGFAIIELSGSVVNYPANITKSIKVSYNIASIETGISLTYLPNHDKEPGAVYNENKYQTLGDSIYEKITTNDGTEYFIEYSFFSPVFMTASNINNNILDIENNTSLEDSLFRQKKTEHFDQYKTSCGNCIFDEGDRKALYTIILYDLNANVEAVSSLNIYEQLSPTTAGG